MTGGHVREQAAAEPAVGGTSPRPWSLGQNVDVHRLVAVAIVGGVAAFLGGCSAASGAISGNGNSHSTPSTSCPQAPGAPSGQPNVAIKGCGTNGGGILAPAAGSSDLPTTVNQKQAPAGLRFLACRLNASHTEVQASGTFAQPFPYSGGTISLALFNPAHPGGGWSGPEVLTSKGATTWSTEATLKNGWVPTLCEIGISGPGAPPG